METETVKIEIGIKIPPKLYGLKGPQTAFTKAMAALKPGQSIFSKKLKLDNISAAAQSYIGKGKYAIRTTDGGVRVWRLK